MAFVEYTGNLVKSGFDNVFGFIENISWLTGTKKTRSNPYSALDSWDETTIIHKGLTGAFQALNGILFMRKDVVSYIYPSIYPGGYTGGFFVTGIEIYADGALVKSVTNISIPRSEFKLYEGTSTFDNLIYGGKNTIKGSVYNDTLYTLGRDGDILFGSLGDDTLIGGPGNDLIDGGPGTDYVVYESVYSELSFKVNGADIIVSSKSEGVDTVRSVEYVVAGDIEYKMSDILTAKIAAYSLNSNAVSINEGATAQFSLVTTNVVSGTVITYSVSGVSVSDLQSGSLTGTVSVSSTGTTTINIPIASDGVTEGAEILTLIVQGKSASVVINDTSTAASSVKNENHKLSVIVDKGILGADAVLLKGLTESITITDGVTTQHSVEYSGKTYNYSQIDALITTVTRDNEFTSEFTKEINDHLKSDANITYAVAVGLVGIANIDTILINIAGSDGNYIT